MDIGQTTVHGHPQQQPPPAGPHAQEVHIHVNEKPVHMAGNRHTGLEIKQAAIAQDVKIQLDFLLYLLRPHQPNKQVGDDEEVTITDGSRFHAIADDDNSSETSHDA